METIPLSFRFKGERNYVHGTDMFTEFTRILSQANDLSLLTRFRMRIRRLVRNESSFVLGPQAEDAPIPESAAADIRADFPGKTLVGYLMEGTGPVTGRYPYDEDKVKALCTIADKSITIFDDPHYLPIEVMVAMNKILHYHLFPPKKGRWLFSQLDISRLPDRDEATKFSIEVVHNLNNMFTKSKITVDKNPLGFIYFSLESK
jgi:hypothetical protein